MGCNLFQMYAKQFKTFIAINIHVFVAIKHFQYTIKILR